MELLCEGAQLLTRCAQARGGLLGNVGPVTGAGTTEGEQQGLLDDRFGLHLLPELRGTGNRHDVQVGVVMLGEVEGELERGVRCGRPVIAHEKIADHGAPSAFWM